jgi:hypothetical protein
MPLLRSKVPARTEAVGVGAEIAGRRLWAVFMLARSLEVAESILRGRPVMVRNLESEALRRARRGMPAPDPASYFRVRRGHLDAAAEAGPLARTGLREP